MKSRVWRMAGVGFLCMSVNLPLLAEGQGAAHGGSPLQSRPDEVRQTQEPRIGYYQDIPRRNDSRYYQAGHPENHGNGWGPGPQYRPGHSIERFPDPYWKVPYRGQDYFYSGGYWYRPQGPRYVVVTPPYGVRVNYLPDYARQVWVGSALYFLAAGTYYQYLNDSREYVVVSPPGPGAVEQNPQQDRDRYECYRWAVEQTGFDPATATYAPSAQVADNYRWAQGACLSGRGL
ncbi:hypothetical protein PS652_00174 [Pseudomonas fluorescens]|uniref:Glycine zipper family protein n=1 Tax=Pseudomonas fluorescens TaxID=294 RepID=A0A5E6UB25_PSEFL|nr:MULTISPECIES: DUF6515 family protein [Pseudomonas]VVN02742.1 hypothetical protein PS652_03384 [Pseudomonas fluorescens]